MHLVGKVTETVLTGEKANLVSPDRVTQINGERMNLFVGECDDGDPFAFGLLHRLDDEPFQDVGLPSTRCRL